MKRVPFFAFCLFVVLLLCTQRSSLYAQTGPNDAAKRRADSLRAANKRRTDSLAVINSYKQSKKYKDSVEAARQRRVDAQKAKIKNTNDSLTAIRKNVADSIMAYRRGFSDSIKRRNDSIRFAQQKQLQIVKEERKRVSDSLAAIRTYRESKRYKDSITTARQVRTDSIAKVRKTALDSIKGERKRYNDSIMSIRKAYNDSMRGAINEMKATRMAQLDSLRQIREARADSMGKVRVAREELRKQKGEEREKKKKDKLKLALELKIKKKQDSYTNEKMRKKKWNLPRKITQNTFTRYNYYFNADKKMEEAIANMVRSNTDNYDSLIPLFPFNPDKDSTKLKSDMDTIISKASVGIQIHDPRAKWQDDLYLLLGQAYYYKGDYQNAGSAFKFIVNQNEIAKKEKAKKEGYKPKDKTKPVSFSEPEKDGVAGLIEHKSSVNEAMLWLSRTLAQSKKEGQAQTVLDMLRNDANFPERLAGTLAVEQAFIDLERRDFSSAVKALALAAGDQTLPKWLRIRINYLAGQIYQQFGNHTESNKHFDKVIDLHPNIEMDFYARKSIAVNSIENKEEQGDAFGMLKKMSGEDKYKQYFDQIHYSLGKLATKGNNSDLAIESYKNSVKYGQNNRKQKGLSYAALGDELYKKSDYITSKKYYDSATQFLGPDQRAILDVALQRSAALDIIASPAIEVKKLDSLLHLSSLSEREQRSAVRNYLKELERKMRDSVFLASQSNANSMPTPMNNTANQAWYFANPNLMRNGENDFKQKWGTRTLKDNWRLSGGVSSGNNNIETVQEEPSKDPWDNLPSEDSLLSFIPKTTEQIAETNNGLKEALFALGKAYYSQLEDYENALKTFDTLSKRYPKHKNEPEELYLRYLMAMRKNESSLAQNFNNTLQTSYPESEWAKLLSKGSQSEGAVSNAAMLEVGKLYDESYNYLLQRQFQSALDNVVTANEKFKNQGNYRKKFEVLNGVATAGIGQFDKADSILSLFVAMNANDTLTSWANTVLEYIRKQKTAAVAGAQTATNNPNSVVDPLGLDANQPYAYTPKQKHYVIIHAKVETKFSALKSGLSDYNLMMPGKGNITATLTSLDAASGLIVCKEFKDASDAKKYVSELKAVNVLFREYKPSEYDITVISEENYPKLLYKKSYFDYKTFYNKSYK